MQMQRYREGWECRGRGGAQYFCSGGTEIGKIIPG